MRGSSFSFLSWPLMVSETGTSSAGEVSAGAAETAEATPAATSVSTKVRRLNSISSTPLLEANSGER